jgi:hypothetical protein
LEHSFTSQADRLPKFERDEIDEQLSRVLGSANFRASPVLKSFLQFIVTKAMDGMEDALTEQSIATEVFSRDSKFDCSVDTVVRTHAYRLRQKLKEYYMGPGLADAILIEVPKGHYRARFSRREIDISLLAYESPAEGVPLPVRPKTMRRGAAITGFAFAGLALLAAGIWIGTELRLWDAANAPKELSRSQVEVDEFWRQFLGADQSPVIAYSNDLYLTTESGNLKVFSGPAADRGTIASDEAVRRGVPEFDLSRNTGPFYFEDDKTDIGEVEGASVLTAQLVRMGLHPMLKRGRVITTYDLESHNVIFLGSPFANKILSQIEGNANFVFRDASKRPSVWGGAIRNLHPLAGESKAYSLERDTNTLAFKADYAVVTSLPSITSPRKILVLGGLTTSGTQAAAQFATSPTGVAAMSARLGQKRTRSTQWPSHFEYLLRATLDHGLDLLRTECLASRTRSDSEAGQH